MYRNPDKYLRERLSSRFRKQLLKLGLEVEKLLDRRSLDDLSPDEVYVLAKVLPEFTQEKRLFAYKGVLQESLAEGHFDSTRSQAMLAHIRRQLKIGEGEHRELLADLGIDNANWQAASSQPSKQEDLKRAIGYRQALSRVQWVQHRLLDGASSGQDRLIHIDPSYAITSGRAKALGALRHLE